MNKKRVIESLKLKALNIGMKAVCLIQDLVLEHDWIYNEITVFGSLTEMTCDNVPALP